MSVYAHQKNYLADKKPFFKHFYPNDIAITAVRSVAIQGLMVFNGYVASLELEDSDDEDSSDDEEVFGKKKSDKPEFVAPSMEEFGSSCIKSFVKSISITTYLRSLEEVALRHYQPRVVSKLIKGERFSQHKRLHRGGCQSQEQEFNFFIAFFRFFGRCEQVCDPKVRANDE